MNEKKRNKISCIIIDDDPTITDLVDHFCSKIGSIEYCIQCHSPVDGLRLISEQKYDILFLDFNMPEINGETILKIKQDDSKVVMITSNPDFALDSYNYPDVIDYLLKPIKFDRFAQSVEKFLQLDKQSNTNNSFDKKNNNYYIKDGNRWVKISLAECTYLKSESNYVSWQVQDKKILSLDNLKDLEDKLPAEFIRVHRSFIVNKNHIDFITKDDISVGNQLIPVGKKYKEIIASLVDNFK